MPKEETGKAPLIFMNMLKVMTAIEKITKDQKNVKQNFNFRGIDDAYNALHSILADNDIFCTSKIIGEPAYSEVTTKAGGKGFHTRIRYEFTFRTIDGSWIVTEVMGESIDYGDKGCAKTLSIAHKSALFSTFLIPTGETPDPDHDSHDLKSAEKMTKEVFDSPSEKDVPDGKPLAKSPIISEPQRKRLFAISKTHEWTQESVKELIAQYGYESTKEITKKHYEAICNLIEGKKEGSKPEQDEHGF